MGIAIAVLQVRHGYALRPDVHALVEALLSGGVEARWSVAGGRWGGGAREVERRNMGYKYGEREQDIWRLSNHIGLRSRQKRPEDQSFVAIGGICFKPCFFFSFRLHHPSCQNPEWFQFFSLVAVFRNEVLRSFFEALRQSCTLQLGVPMQPMLAKARRQFRCGADGPGCQVAAGEW